MYQLLDTFRCRFNRILGLGGLVFLGLAVLVGETMAHKLETGEAVLTLTADRVWILETDINLTRYIQSNPEIADTVRPIFRELEKDGVLKDSNFKDWETVFRGSEEQFKRELQVYDSGKIVGDFELWFPHPSELLEATYDAMKDEGLHVKVYATGKLANEDSDLQFRFPLDVGEVILTTIQPNVEWVVTGELSRPVGLNMGSETSSTAGNRLSSILGYLRIGFIHIVPRGLDHILFVVGLFLLAPRIRPLLIQVSAFTVAHTITLALSVLGVFSLPLSIVEPLIALSIALVAFENIITDRIHPWRPVLVFLFGLLHGLGFAGVLGGIGLPQGDFLWALILFNVGVEIGQLVVLMGVFALCFFFMKKSWYRKRLTMPASFLIGLVGLYWTVERLIG
mgnify:CR=1 FL=1